jgi:ribosomal protein L11 methyltransferase
VSAPTETWHAVDAAILPEAREAIEYALMEAGASGTETNETGQAEMMVTGYFETGPDIDDVRASLVDGLRIYNLAESQLIDLKVRAVADRDWLAEWKKHWQPAQVGRFIISPPWIDTEALAIASGPGSNPIIINIDPGMAFGTGTHETTQLCLKAIEKHFRGGSFLDVGTGTGVLAIAAARSFADARIDACDIDVEAIEIAKENARLNDVSHRINFRAGSVDEQTPSADLVCANLTAPVIVELLPQLLAATCGHLILSGILETQLKSVRGRLLELGVNDFDVDQSGEWIAIVV